MLLPQISKVIRVHPNNFHVTDAPDPCFNMAGKTAVPLIEANNITDLKLADMIKLRYFCTMITSFDRA